MQINLKFLFAISLFLSSCFFQPKLDQVLELKLSGDKEAILVSVSNQSSKKYCLLKHYDKLGIYKKNNGDLLNVFEYNYDDHIYFDVELDTKTVLVTEIVPTDYFSLDELDNFQIYELTIEVFECPLQTSSEFERIETLGARRLLELSSVLAMQ